MRKQNKLLLSIERGENEAPGMRHQICKDRMDKEIAIRNPILDTASLRFPFDRFNFALAKILTLQLLRQT